jgi:hypothetical protein
MNKSLITNAISAGLVVTGLVVESPMREPILATGLFALAGGVTNWLAIHMLFEKVPGLYGSGIISARLVMEQFFNKDNLDRFFDQMMSGNEEHQLDFHDVIEEIDLTPAFDSLVATIAESSFGSMLDMLGGEAALVPLKDPFIVKMKASIDDIAHTQSFQSSVRAKLSSGPVSDDIHQQISQIVNARLEELTPSMVKDIIQTMIRQHLGWLVVWGGVFGGLIGLSASQLPSLFS